MVKHRCCVLIECEGLLCCKNIVACIGYVILVNKMLGISFFLIENVSYDMVKHPSYVLFDSYSAMF